MVTNCAFSKKFNYMIFILFCLESQREKEMFFFRNLLTKLYTKITHSVIILKFVFVNIFQNLRYLASNDINYLKAQQGNMLF